MRPRAGLSTMRAWSSRQHRLPRALWVIGSRLQCGWSRPSGARSRPGSGRCSRWPAFRAARAGHARPARPCRSGTRSRSYAQTLTRRLDRHIRDDCVVRALRERLDQPATTWGVVLVVYAVAIVFERLGVRTGRTPATSSSTATWRRRSHTAASPTATSTSSIRPARSCRCSCPSRRRATRRAFKARWPCSAPRCSRSRPDGPAGSATPAAAGPAGDRRLAARDRVGLRQPLRRVPGAAAPRRRWCCSCATGRPPRSSSSRSAPWRRCIRRAVLPSSASGSGAPRAGRR